MTPEGIKKETFASLYAGTAERHDAATPQDLLNIIESLSPRQALAAGVLAKGRSRARINTSAKATGQEAARTKDHFTYPDAPGWLLWDYDSKTMPPEVSARIEALGGPIEALFHIWPEGRNAPHLIRASSSDGIEAANGERITSDGLHGLFLIDNVSRSKEALSALEARAWANGLAWCALSKSGAVLIRSIVDASVGSPERLIFEAPPVLGDGLQRSARAPIIHNTETPAAVPEVSPEVAEAANRAEQAARARIKPEAIEQEQAFVTEKAETAAKISGRTVAQERKAITQMLKGGVLLDSHLLEMPDGRFVTVGHILDNPALFDRKGIPDPVEGLEYGPNKATLLLSSPANRPDILPRLVSHAHGARAVYRFARFETPEKPPHHPAPKDPREKALKGHRATVSDTIRHAIKITRAAKAVARGYKLFDEEHPDTTEAEKAKAKRLIRSEVQARFNLDYLPSATVTTTAKPPRVMLSGAQGVGKTTQAEIELTKAYGVTTLALMPDHGKAEEFALSYEERRKAGSPPVLVMRGRDQIDTAKADGRKMCLVPEAANALAKRGLSPKQVLCTGCPLREQCGYVEQEVEAARLAHSGQGVVLVAPHEYAFLTLPNNIKPDLVLFDEAPRNLAVEHVALSFDALSEPLKYEPKQPRFGKVQSAAGMADAEQGALLIRWLRITLRNAFQDNPAAPLATLRAEGVTPELVRKAIAALGDFMDQEIRAKVAEVTPFFTFSKEEARALERSWVKVIEDHQHKNISAFKRICETLLCELSTNRDTPNALTYSQNINAGTKGKDAAKGIVAHILKRPTFSETTPFLHLDGTGNHKLAEAIFGPIEHAQYRVDRLANITQVIGRTFSNVSITGEGFTGTKAKEAEQLRREIIAYCQAKPEAVVIACKTVIEALQSDGLQNDTAHFCALRGRNTWERYQAAIIIGRAEPSAGTVEPDARAFAATDEAPFQSIRQPDGTFPRYPKEPRTIRTRQGPPVAIDVNTHPDPWANAVLEQMRDAEVIQAVDRLRLAFEDQGKRVFLLSPVVLDLTVDAVETWTDAKKGGSRLSQVIESAGVIPLNKREACRYFPEIWTHERSAERDVKPVAERVEMLKSLLAQNPNNILYLENAPLSETLLIEYTSIPKEGGRARARQALVWAASADEARAKVEALTGPLKAFALVDGWKDAVEAAELAADLQAERAAIQEIENAPEPPEAPEEAPRGVVIALNRDAPQEAPEAVPARAVGPPG